MKIYKIAMNSPEQLLQESIDIAESIRKDYAEKGEAIRPYQYREHIASIYEKSIGLGLLQQIHSLNFHIQSQVDDVGEVCDEIIGELEHAGRNTHEIGLLNYIKQRLEDLVKTAQKSAEWANKAQQSLETMKTENRKLTLQ